MEMTQLKTKMEQIELEINLAEFEAKLKALENFETQNEQHLPTPVSQAQNGDGMNEETYLVYLVYLETYQEITDVTVNPEASPEAPLQGYLNQQPKPIISSQRKIRK